MASNKIRNFIYSVVLVLLSTAIGTIIVYSLFQFVNILFDFKFKQTPEFIFCYGFSAFLGAIFSRVNSKG